MGGVEVMDALDMLHKNIEQFPLETAQHFPLWSKGLERWSELTTNLALAQQLSRIANSLESILTLMQQREEREWKKEGK